MLHHSINKRNDQVLLQGGSYEHNSESAAIPRRIL
jgi:hypothetical protein